MGARRRVPLKPVVQIAAAVETIPRWHFARRPAHPQLQFSLDCGDAFAANDLEDDDLDCLVFNQGRIIASWSALACSSTYISRIDCIYDIVWVVIKCCVSGSFSNVIFGLTSGNLRPFSPV